MTNPPAEGIVELWATGEPVGITNPPTGDVDGLCPLGAVPGGIANPPANEGGVGEPVAADVGNAGGGDERLAETGPVGGGVDGDEPGSG